MDAPAILIGIQSQGDKVALSVQLDAIVSAISVPHGIVAIAPGPASLPANVASIKLDPDSSGSPAAFNRLIRHADASIYILLEQGCIPGPGCIDRLVVALEADPARGLAGPSTNRAWNPQGTFSACAGNAEAIAATARQAAALHGLACQPLTPLHSLGDFCYAVTRQVVDAVGAADEAYGDGPCWEMDYNIRAARAGFTGVWVKGAFAWRAPFDPARAAAEAHLLERNKQLYQRRFCARQLRGPPAIYRSHCAGDACANFAPADRITIHRSFAEGEPATRPPATASAPLVSCIMPTANRRAFVPAAIAAFQAQDYEPRELVIIDDGEDPVADLIPSDDERIRYMRLPGRLPLGAKRNLACEHAHGTIIVHWDDDDWHAPDRLSYQVADLLASGRPVAGCDALWFYAPDRGQAWEYRYAHPSLRWVAGASLCYFRDFWQTHPFEPLNEGEDTRFVFSLPPDRIYAHARHDMTIARIHPGNSGRKTIAPPLWRQTPVDPIRQLTELWSAAAIAKQQPRISCIMPTRNRRDWALQAIRFFHAQDVDTAELIIVDDGQPGLEAALPSHPRVRYVLMRQSASIGAKRNLACDMAQGDYFVLWDDDDWHGPTRLSRQIAPLEQGRAAITALRQAPFYDLARDAWWTCAPRLHRRIFEQDVIGGTLAFHKDLFARLKFPSISLGEDADFLRRAVATGHRLKPVEADGDYAYIRHGQNTWRFELGNATEGWLPAAPPPGFDAHRAFYEAQAARLGYRPEFRAAM